MWKSQGISWSWILQAVCEQSLLWVYSNVCSLSCYATFELFEKGFITRVIVQKKRSWCPSGSVWMDSPPGTPSSICGVMTSLLATHSVNCTVLVSDSVLTKSNIQLHYLYCNSSARVKHYFYCVQGIFWSCHSKQTDNMPHHWSSANKNQWYKPNWKKLHSHEKHLKN